MKTILEKISENSLSLPEKSLPSEQMEIKNGNCMVSEL
jgi:hypothetical protein